MLTLFSCGQDILSFNFLLSWILLSEYFLLQRGEDFCSSPVWQQVCSPESMVWKNSLQLLAECPLARCCLSLFTCCFFRRPFPCPHGSVLPKPLLLWNPEILAKHQESAQKWGKLSLVLGEVCFWSSSPWQDVATWTSSAMWQRAKWGLQRGHGLWAGPQVPQALSPTSFPSGFSRCYLSVLPDPHSSHDQQHPFSSH